MSDINKFAERLFKMSDTMSRFDEQMKKHGARQHLLASCKEALLGAQAIIESAVEVIEETEKTEKTATSGQGQEIRKVKISD
ncbi:hypothetical protein [Paenibacillus sp. LHD-38]|uniref:hypothetical protein n=1 Tax=Paenibacillus sp. LHD-38 TaxID=3072143 RepID=UPI00280EFD1F|nr:hypothetical protein [Paenibacillus sp. LHD-38]MDQ8733640.1 hypothetical protein [Paenibacillus sp. LHD-38]